MRLTSGILILIFTVFAAHIAAAQTASASQTHYITYTQACQTGGISGLSNTATGGSIPLPSESTAIALSIIALSLAIDVVAVGYMINAVLPGTKLKSWLSGEYYEIAKSALLVAAIYTIITLVSSIALIVSGVHSPGNSYIPNIGALITASESYFCSVGNAVQPAWEFIGAESIGIGVFQNMVIGLWVPIPLPLIPPDGGSAILSGFIMNIYQNFMLESGNIIIQHFESMIYDLTQYVLFPVTALDGIMIPGLPLLVSVGLTVLIPMGLVLRAFPVVRGVGGTLIAMGISMALIFPATLVLLNLPVSAWAANVLPQPSPIIVTNPFTGTIYVIANSQLVSSVTAMLDNTASINYGLEAMLGGIFPFVNDVIHYAFYLIVQFLLFVLDLMIIYPLTDSIAKSLGGTIRLNLGGKLKLA